MTLQTLVDAREELNIRAYEVWSGWQQEHALAEIERESQREALRPSGKGRVNSASPSDLAREWPVFWFLMAAFAIGGLVGLRFW